MGAGGLERLLKRLNIPLSYNQFLFIGIMCLIIATTLHFIRGKLYGE